MDSTFLATQFGESNYGQRLNYARPKYRDAWAAILYVVHIVVIIGVGVYLWSVKMDTVNGSGDGDSDTINFTGVFLTILACMFSGTLFGLFWLKVIQKFAGTIIKMMLFLNIGLWLALAVIGVITTNVGLIVFGVICALIFALYAWCIWGRIPFASALLSISGKIIDTYSGTVVVSLAVLFLSVVWILVWFTTFIGYLVVSDNNNDTNNFVIFLFLISFYWGIQVNQNVNHTTACGVAATWYFSPPGEIHSPTSSALKRTLTTSFGSVCLGSLIVAIIQAVKAMLRGAKKRNAAIACIAMCLLSCIERIMRYFNTYAFCHCAIYGTSFCESGKATWELFKTRGFSAIINDDLTGMALVCGCLIGLLVSAGVGVLGFAFYDSGDGDWYPLVPIILIIAGAFIGYVFCACVLIVVRSGIVTLFVCYAEDPATMFNNHKEEYQRIVDAKNEWGHCYNQHSGNNYPGQGQGQQQTTV